MSSDRERGLELQNQLFKNHDDNGHSDSLLTQILSFQQN